ncbi:hypothetical protein EDB87DRAFT_1833293 [Lactarius vividus]|nr:hypothetical protein EDB87DRAFT_1833293 [Lactarius vividus]
MHPQIRALADMFSNSFIATSAAAGNTAYDDKPAHNSSLDPAPQATQPAKLDTIAMALFDATIFDLGPTFQFDAALAAPRALQDASKRQANRPAHLTSPGIMENVCDPDIGSHERCISLCSITTCSRKVREIQAAQGTAYGHSMEG